MDVVVPWTTTQSKETTVKQNSLTEVYYMTDKKPALEGDTKKQLTGRKCKELDSQTVAMLEAQEVTAITGDGEEWWCPNPDCEVVDK